MPNAYTTPAPTYHLAEDMNFLAQLQRTMMALPDELVLVAPARAGKTAAARFRCDVDSVLRAFHELLVVVQGYAGHPPWSALEEPLKRWRAARSKIAERLPLARTATTSSPETT